MMAAQDDRAGVVKLLLAAGANVNAVANNGYTALMIASEKGYTDVVQLLSRSSWISYRKILILQGGHMPTVGM